MTLPIVRSFRGQLTLAGFAAIYLPLLALFGVASVTEDESVAIVDGAEVVTSSSGDGLLWVRVAVVALAPAALALAWWWAGRAVRPIERIRSVAEHIEATDLGARIGLATGPAELVGLAASFDAMLDRLNRAADRQREVIDEMSHELRTPIAVLVANADVRLARAEADEAWYRDGLAQSRVTADRMRATLDRLLVQARGDAHVMARHPSDVMEATRLAAAEARVVAEGRGVEVAVTGPDRVSGAWDAEMVGRAVANLLDNAVRHAPDGGTVRVTVRDDGAQVAIAVSDDGPGIPPGEHERVFERAWSGTVDGGRGLGLAIARQIAEAHGGGLVLRSPDGDDAATTFELTLPR